MASYTDNNGVVFYYLFISGKNEIEINGIDADPSGELILTIPDTLKGAPVVQIATTIPTNTAELYIGKNMRYIDIPAAFNQAHNIHTIHVADLNNYYKTINGVLFEKDELTLVYYPSGNLTETYVIPNTVETIGSYAFMNSNAQHIIISDSVKNIQSYAFNSCRHIKEIIIPDNVAFLGGSNFYQCMSMTKATIGRGITEIHDYTFYGCNNLVTITLPYTVSFIGNDCFYINNYDKVTRHIYYKGTPWQKEHNLRYDVSIGTNKQIMESFVWHYSLDGRIKTSQGLKNINEVYVIVKDADTLIRKPIYDFL